MKTTTPELQEIVSKIANHLQVLYLKREANPADLEITLQINEATFALAYLKGEIGQRIMKVKPDAND